MSLESLFTQFSTETLRKFTERIDVCLGQLTAEQIWERGSTNENAIGNLVLHLTGNVRQWIVSSLGSNPVPRDRDAEFSAVGGLTGAQLSAGLHEVIAQATATIEGLDTERLTRTYEIQGYSPSGLEAVYHVVEHFGQHTGQIIFITKMLTGGDLGFYAHLKNPASNEQ